MWPHGHGKKHGEDASACPTVGIRNVSGKRLIALPLCLGSPGTCFSHVARGLVFWRG